MSEACSTPPFAFFADSLHFHAIRHKCYLIISEHRAFVKLFWKYFKFGYKNPACKLTFRPFGGTLLLAWKEEVNERKVEFPDSFSVKFSGMQHFCRRLWKNKTEKVDKQRKKMYN